MKTKASTRKFEKIKETFTTVKKIRLDGVKTLKAEEITTTFEVKRELSTETNRPLSVVSRKKVDRSIKAMSFQLIEVTPEELLKYRMSGFSSFVLKVNSKLYYTSIPDNISFVSSVSLGVHQCSGVECECCNRLSAASDEDGGCAKVRDRSKYIERYPWITKGYETFNTKHDSFVVLKCEHYEEWRRRE